MKILFLVPYPTEGASNRVRVEQFIPYLESKGAKTKVRPFVTKRFYQILYLPHAYLEKTFWFIVCTANRLVDIFRALFYDVILIHREAYPFGGAFIETILQAMGKPIIFDFDDAIFLPNTSKENKYINRFKRPGKIAGIIAMSKLVIAGNDYLKEFARKYNDNIVVIPSSVDTDIYKPVAEKVTDGCVTVGWIGSVTTKDFLPDIEDVFVKLSDKYDNLVFKVVGARFQSSKLTNIVNKNWTMASEVGDLQSFDIGIMPVPDNEWAKGKCGFKAILYMSCGLPVVASPVGVNTEIVEDGVTGYLAHNNDEWIKKLSILIEDSKLRSQMGAKGREKVVNKYSITHSAPLLYVEIRKVLDGSKK